MKLPLATLVLFAALMSGCSIHKRAGASRSYDHNVITREQILDNHFHTAYEAVEALHAIWLQTRGTDSLRTPGEVKVIYDSTEMGGIESLKSISTISIVYIRWYDGTAASTRWGIGHEQGVIFVSSHSD